MAVNDEYIMPGDICHPDGCGTTVMLVDAGKDSVTGEQIWELKLVSGNGVFAVTEIPRTYILRLGEWLTNIAKE